MVEPVLNNHIEISPGVCGGRPRIAGHRIRVQDVVAWHEQLGLSPDEIVSRYPQLTLGDVYAALAYYYDHRNEIRRSMEEDNDLANAMKVATPSKLLRKLTSADPGSDSVPPR